MSDRKKPYVIEEDPGTKAYCACDRSGNKPYCDGAHQGTGQKPFVVMIEDKKRSRSADAENQRTCHIVTVLTPRFPDSSAPERRD